MACGTRAFAERLRDEIFSLVKPGNRGKAIAVGRLSDRRFSAMRPISSVHLFKKRNTPEPWNIPTHERVRAISEGASKRKVAYIYERPDSGTFRYRAYNMCQALSYSDSWAGSYFFESELPLLTNHLDRIGAVVFVRTKWSLAMDLFVHAVRDQGIPALFDIDDLACDVTSLPLVMNTLNVNFDHPRAYENWFSSASRLWLMGSLCDATIGTNDYLCGKLSRLFEKPSYAVRNFLNDEQVQVSEKLFEEKGTRANGRPFVIGYFSGTPWHTNDFRKVSPEIGELMARYPDITLEIVGLLDLPDVLNSFRKAGRIVRRPLVDFLTLQQRIARDQANIVPLVDNEFTNCKSELKFFEAAIVGTITCATPTYAYRTSIQHKQTGFLCEEGQWYSALEAIYKNDVPHDMVSKARDYCLEKYAPQEQVSRIEDVLHAALANGNR
jgi:glycosyltransferase involved in cell wall biosynthesis